LQLWRLTGTRIAHYNQSKVGTSLRELLVQQNPLQFASPSLEEFEKLARPGAVIPVYVTLCGDYLTPVTAYERLSKLSRYSFLLESVVGGEQMARYSFLGSSPHTVVSARGDKVCITEFSGAQEHKKEFTSADPLRDLEKLLSGVRAVHQDNLPAFTGGAVGYAGYDTVRYLEPEKLASPPRDDRDLPDLLFGIYDDLVIFDHVRKTIIVTANVRVGFGPVRSDYNAALGRIERIVEALSTPLPARLGMVNLTRENRPAYRSNFTREEFEKAVLAAKEYIKAGDIFQVVLSQRLEMTTSAHPFDIYRALRMVNPSPFMFYLTAPECTLVGSSPEIMCRVQDGVITSRPLAGTRRRGATPEEDERLEKELLADPKERAEHIMLVDLGRNDVGRIAQLGTVKISDVMTIERYSHVMHIVSNVTGKLADSKTCFDALRITLPVGTVSGAPKIRAMQIIDELEPTRRGPYAGAVGYVDYAGNMDTCIALRTMVVTRAAGSGGKDGGEKFQVYVQAGGGLVADSVPAEEYQESLNKAAALLKAVALAEQGLG
jgi:anthranilate synthase component I